jgi:hypothetical protein
MCCCFKGSSKGYNLSLPDIKAGFIFLFDKEELLVRNMMKGKDIRKHQAKKQNTYQATGVTLVVKPLTAWVLAKFIGDEVTAVNICYMSFPMSKQKLDIILFEGLYHFSISFERDSNGFFAAFPPSTQDRLLLVQIEPVQCHQSILVIERWKFSPQISE